MTRRLLSDAVCRVDPELVGNPAYTVYNVGNELEYFFDGDIDVEDLDFVFGRQGMS